MDEQEARLILQSRRPDELDPDDPQFAAAMRAAAENPELARWLAEEQAFDRAIAAHLEAVPAPFGLKTRILACGAPATRRTTLSWVAGLAAFAVAVALIAQAVGFWRTPKQITNSPAEYAHEMVSFVQLPPPLEMKSKDLGEIQNWLAKKDLAATKVPARLAALAPLGCRILSFRDYQVTLICFEREKNRLAHIFTVDRAAIPNMKAGDKPIFANEQGWMTATWVEDNRVYMVAMQGSRAALEKYLPDA